MVLAGVGADAGGGRKFARRRVKAAPAPSARLVFINTISIKTILGGRGPPRWHSVAPPPSGERRKTPQSIQKTTLYGEFRLIWFHSAVSRGFNPDIRHPSTKIEAQRKDPQIKLARTAEHR
jgi:hypothetical protein